GSGPGIEGSWNPRNNLGLGAIIQRDDNAFYLRRELHLEPYQSVWHFTRRFMARIKLAYIGGGGTRAPGTLASLLHRGAEFDGSEVVLIDLDPERLEVVKTIAQKIARNKGLDFTI